jgi:hypothetical protein
MNSRDERGETDERSTIIAVAIEVIRRREKLIDLTLAINNAKRQLIVEGHRSSRTICRGVRSALYALKICKSLTNIQRFGCPSDFIESDGGVLRLPDGPEPVELSMNEVEHGVSGAGEGIILETTNNEVAGWVHCGLRWVGDLESVDAPFQTIDVGTGEKILLGKDIELFSPLEVQITA